MKKYPPACIRHLTWILRFNIVPDISKNGHDPLQTVLSDSLLVELTKGHFSFIFLIKFVCLLRHELRDVMKKLNDSLTCWSNADCTAESGWCASYHAEHSMNIVAWAEKLFLKVHQPYLLRRLWRFQSAYVFNIHRLNSTPASIP